MSETPASTDATVVSATSSDAVSDKPESPKPVTKKVSFNDNHTPSSASNPSDEKEVVSPSILKKTVEKPPPRPARPLSPRAKAKKTLKDAFPDLDEKYVNAVLIASEGDLNPAFNALLYISDPDSKIEVPQPRSRPARPAKPTPAQAQLLEDERLARKLAREFERPVPPPKPQHPEEPDVLNQFLDEDLPQLKKQFEKGLEDTTKKIGTFFSGITKQFNNESDSEDDTTQYSTYQFKTNRNRQNRQNLDMKTRMNTQRNKTLPKAPGEEDEDSRLFGALGSLGSPPTSARNSATFKREDPLENSISLIDNQKGLPEVPIAKQEKKAAKWEPLADVPPQPVEETFLVTSSDDEEEEGEDEEKEKVESKKEKVEEEKK